MVSLAALWRSLGVEPAAVVGHSQGEVIAACVAGALTLEDAATVVVSRSTLLKNLAGQGGLLSVALPADEVEKRLERWSGRASVAAVNGPSAVIVSGDNTTLDELLAECERDAIRAKRVPDSVPSHSAHVEFLEERLLADLAGITPRTGDVPFYSTVTGELVDGAELDAAYWYRNLREPVRFESVVGLLVGLG
ncbi:acyltransferase domain-containing protein, partial [Streptomyces sp. HSW2009]|uniref:acyltransferase domain-containing protein n=1 Tax=Streptomyces sp. HSW2009 TaxID=3142890 RepID=UPI0032EF3DE2